MLRRLAFCLPLALVVAACGGGDDSSDAATTVETLAPATTIVVPDGSAACEDAPDPADYEAIVPVVRRPCELPTEVTTTVVVDGVGYAAEPGDGVIYQVTAIDASDGSLIGSTWTTGQPTNIPQIALGATPDTTVPGSTDSTTATTPTSVPATEGTLDEELIGAQVGARIRIDVPAGTPGAGALFGEATVQAETPVTYVIEPVVVVPPLVAADSPRPHDRPVGRRDRGDVRRPGRRRRQGRRTRRHGRRGDDDVAEATTRSCCSTRGTRASHS
ncbi:MAG: hypothetical protein R2697_22205 [Ilumatobacteraceae bacterium]